MHGRPRALSCSSKAEHLHVLHGDAERAAPAVGAPGSLVFLNSLDHLPAAATKRTAASATFSTYPPIPVKKPPRPLRSSLSPARCSAQPQDVSGATFPRSNVLLEHA